MSVLVPMSLENNIFSIVKILGRVYTDMRFFNARVTGAHAML